MPKEDERSDEHMSMENYYQKKVDELKIKYDDYSCRSCRHLMRLDDMQGSGGPCSTCRYNPYKLGKSNYLQDDDNKIAIRSQKRELKKYYEALRDY